MTPVETPKKKSKYTTRAENPQKIQIPAAQWRSKLPSKNLEETPKKIVKTKGEPPSKIQEKGGFGA